MCLRERAQGLVGEDDHDGVTKISKRRRRGVIVRSESKSERALPRGFIPIKMNARSEIELARDAADVTGPADCSSRRSSRFRPCKDGCCRNTS